jgi:hypothetical protein
MRQGYPRLEEHPQPKILKAFDRLNTNHGATLPP